MIPVSPLALVVQPPWSTSCSTAGTGRRVLRLDTLPIPEGKRSHTIYNGAQNQIHCLLRSGFISHNAVVIEIPDYGQVQYAPFGVDVGDIRYLFAVWPVHMELPAQQIFVPLHLHPSAAISCGSGFQTVDHTSS